jgi:hypothetical protein
MRVGARDLVAWSFLMASAHGAGLMLVPLLLRLSDSPAHGAHDHAAHAAPVLMAAAPVAELAAVGVHTGAMFLAMAGVALLVYEKLGLAVLRRAWFNLDLLWAATLIVTGVLSFVL